MKDQEILKALCQCESSIYIKCTKELIDYGPILFWRNKVHYYNKQVKCVGVYQWRSFDSFNAVSDEVQMVRYEALPGAIATSIWDLEGLIAHVELVKAQINQ